MREAAGDIVGAERLAQRAANAGYTSVMEAVSDMQELLEGPNSLGIRLSPADRMFLLELDGGRDYIAQSGLLWMKARRGGKDMADAIAGLEHIARELPGDEALGVVKSLEQVGDTAGAEHLARWAADAGSEAALVRLVELREQAGDTTGAEHLARNPGSAWALGHLAKLREQAGDIGQAERLARLAADAGGALTLRRLAESRKTEPIWSQTLRYGLEPDGHASDPWHQ